MNKQEITNQLIVNHRSFTDYIDFLSDEEFVYSNNHKWSAGQQLEHIILAVRPITQGLMLPAFVFGFLFGKSNRPSRTYEELILKYRSKLKAGGVASRRFVPPVVSHTKRAELIQKLNSLINKLTRQLNGISENDLDRYVLPHPLLGKLTLREMMYFTIFHVEHHRENIKLGLLGYRCVADQQGNTL